MAAFVDVPPSARRHGVTARGPDINVSGADAGLEPDPNSSGGQAVRLGLAAVRHLGDTDADRVVAERAAAGGAFADLADLVRRTGLSTPQVEALATAGAFASLGLDRRAALWTAGAAARDRPTLLPGTTLTSPPPSLPGMTAFELLAADCWATGITPDAHPVQLLRAQLDQLGATPADRLHDVEAGTRILVGGAVTHRQRPPTARGITFLNIEDETGMINVICSPGLYERHRHVARTATALLVRGVLESADGALNLVADHLAPLTIGATGSRSRDYR